MNLELLQLAPKNTTDSSKNSILSTGQQNNSLIEFAGNDEFLQQLQQESKSYELEITEQKLPVSGNNLPNEEGVDKNLSMVIINQEESDLLQSDELINANITSAIALSSPVQPVAMAPLDVKTNQQQVALNRSVDVQLESSEATNDEVYPELLDEEVAEVSSKLMLPELNQKNLMPVGIESGDVKSGRGDAALAIPSMTSHLSLSSKPIELPPNLNASIESSLSNHDAWGDELSNRMAWMVRQDIKVANLRLNPADLGPIEIRIQIKNEQVDVYFNSTHAQVREAIEVSVPRLREMFGEQFLRLDNVNVSQHSFEDQKERSRGDNSEELNAEGGDDASEDELISELSDSSVVAQGKIDYFV